MTIKRLTSIEFGIGFLRADGYEETAALMEAQLAALQQRITNLENSLETMTGLFAQFNQDAAKWVQYQAARALLEEKE